MTIRTVTNIGTVALLLLVQGCGSNNPSTTNTGGAIATGGAATPTGGAIATGGTTAATPTGGAIATGGTTATAPTGGTIAAGGATTPTGGTTGAAGASGTGFTPLCATLVTAANVVPTKGAVCTATDPQLCYKTCGPGSKGFKSETCTGGSYAEQSGCSFPPGDYSCYKIPATISSTCPTTVPQASQSCTVDPCVLCNVNSGYLDSTGNPKVGYCVCQTTSTGAPGTWSCASTTAWPCPGGQGC